MGFSLSLSEAWFYAVVTALLKKVSAQSVMQPAVPPEEGHKAETLATEPAIAQYCGVSIAYLLSIHVFTRTDSMATPRLPFLWPMLKTCDVFASRKHSARSAIRTRALHSRPSRRQQETIPQRYGSANEPPPHLGGGKRLGPSTKQFADEQTKLPKISKKLQEVGEEEVKAEDAEVEHEKRTEPSTVEGSSARPIRMDPMLDAAKSCPPKDAPGAPKQFEETPLESVLDSVSNPAQKQREDQEQQEQANISSSTTINTNSTEEDHPSLSFDEHAPPVRAPHMDTPRHVHHFDTYGLVKRLSDAGWSPLQAITIMKAMRLILADNMALAREALVSKSNVENETYLFRAACAELRTEVMSRRKAEQEKMRTERTQLQHEVDILAQRLSQESGVMKDDIKGMFDDRKMAVRNEQRGMESKVQQLNYKITVSLQADARSDVEGLRWVMTRRVIIALGVVVIMVLGSLRMYSNVVHVREEDARRRASMRSGGTQTDESSGRDYASTGGGGEERSVGGREMLVNEGDNPAFVSLG